MTRNLFFLLLWKLSISFANEVAGSYRSKKTEPFTKQPAPVSDKKFCSFITLFIFFRSSVYILPLPHGHGSLRPILGPFTTVPDFFCSKYSSFLFSSEKMLFHCGSSYNQSALVSTCVFIQSF